MHRSWVLLNKRREVCRFQSFAASMGWVMDQIWFSILLAWLIKTLALRFGGASLYRKTVPFFLGLALGQIVVGGCWLLIDALTGTVGNRLRVY